MTKQDFFHAKLNSYTPQLNQLVGLKKSNKTSDLIDFMTMLHPGQCKQAQGSGGEVFGRKHYVFTIYKTGILRTVAETGARKFYPYEN